MLSNNTTHTKFNKCVGTVRSLGIIPYKYSSQISRRKGRLSDRMLRNKRIGKVSYSMLSYKYTVICNSSLCKRHYSIASSKVNVCCGSSICKRAYCMLSNNNTLFRIGISYVNSSIFYRSVFLICSFVSLICVFVLCCSLAPVYADEVCIDDVIFEGLCAKHLGVTVMQSEPNSYMYIQELEYAYAKLHT